MAESEKQVSVSRAPLERRVRHVKTKKGKMMTKEECFKKLKDAQESDDTECAHEQADMAICDFLTALGHSDIVAE